MNLLTTKFFLSLAMLYFLFVIFPSTYSYTFFTLGFLYLNIGSLFVPFIYMFGDIITELYGTISFRRIALSAAAISLIFTALTFLALKLIEHFAPSMYKVFSLIFQHNYRIIIGVFVGITLSSLLNSYILSYLSKKVRGKFFIFRSTLSSIIGELFESIIVGMIGFLFILPFISILEMAASVMVYRIIASHLLSYPAKVIVVLVRKVDKIPEALLYQ